MHHAHRVLDGDELLAARAVVVLGAPEARQDQRLAPGVQVRAVELGGHLDGQRAALHRGRGDVGVRSGRHEVAAESEEHVDLAVAHGPDRVDGVIAGLARRLEAELVAQRVEEGGLRPLPDAHRAVALHVAVPAHRAGTRARPADVAAQQQEVDDLADRGHRVVVLGEPHRPADDDALGRDHVVDERLDGGPGKAGKGEQIGEVELAPGLGRVVEAVAVGVDEVLVEDGAGRIVVAFEQDPVDRAEQREVAVDAHRKVAVGELRAGAGEPAGRLRVAESGAVRPRAAG